MTECVPEYIIKYHLASKMQISIHISAKWANFYE